MSAARKGSFRMAAACLALAAGLFGAVPASAKGPRPAGPMLWIVADRIVGFVPFTVFLYGKVTGGEPGKMELCRQEVAWLTDTGAANPGRGVTLPPPQRSAQPDDPPCATGRIVRTPDGFDYQHDMRFEKPGTYQVRLSMVDAQGHRVLSNPIQVRAF